MVHQRTISHSRTEVVLSLTINVTIVTIRHLAVEGPGVECMRYMTHPLKLRWEALRWSETKLLL